MSHAGGFEKRSLSICNYYISGAVLSVIKPAAADGFVLPARIPEMTKGLGVTLGLAALASGFQFGSNTTGYSAPGTLGLREE
jgi:hypothetical protein